MQGFWTNATFTPFERPEAFAAKEFFTEEEAAAFEKKRLQDEESQPQDDLHYDNVLWQRENLPKEVSNRRTSIVVDPPDGRVPAQTPAARQRLASRAEMRKGIDASDVEARRCKSNASSGRTSDRRWCRRATTTPCRSSGARLRDDPPGR